MKKHINRHSILLALAASAALALTACSDTAPPASAAPVAPAADPTPAAAETQPAGTVLLSVNPEIEMDYDAAGSVLTLEGKNDDALAVLSGYTGYEGRACADVVGELVGRIHQGGYFDDTISGHERNIVLKLEQGSAQPGEAFLEELAAAAQSASASGQIGSRAVTLDEDDYDDAYGDKGYISAEAAQEVLSAQLQRDDLQFVEREYDLSDGEYELEFVLDGVEYEYEVNAVTGKVTEAERDGADDDGRDDLYDDDWDDGQDDLYDDDWDDSQDDLYDDDWDDGQDDLYDDDWDDGRDDLHDDDWDDSQDDLYDDDWDDDRDDLTTGTMTGMTSTTTIGTTVRTTSTTTGTMTGMTSTTMTATMTGTTSTMTGMMTMTTATTMTTIGMTEPEYPAA